MIILTPLAGAPPVTLPVTVGTNQLYVVPTGTISPPSPSTGVKLNPTSLQTSAVFALINGVGLTVTVNVNDAPGQPVGDTGVISYVAVCTSFVGFVSVPVIILTPLAGAPPVTPPVTLGTDQLYVVPSGTIVVG